MPANRLLITGLAIVSADHMIADAQGVQPESLKPEADQRFFYGQLDAADVLVHGRHSGEGDAGAARRRRIMLTRQANGLARDPTNANAVHWNPASAPLDDALAMLGVAGGTLAVIGGSEVFGLFLERGYDTFHLTRALNVTLPGGRPVFPGIPPRTPESLLSQAGLNAGTTRALDASGDLTLVTWQR